MRVWYTWPNRTVKSRAVVGYNDCTHLCTRCAVGLVLGGQGVLGGDLEGNAGNAYRQSSLTGLIAPWGAEGEIWRRTELAAENIYRSSETERLAGYGLVS
jgi:hypothetical protein